MATYRLLGAAALFAMVPAPATAQQAMGEPGYCAFYYPNANCQNKGPGNPYTGDAWLRLNQGGGAVPRSGPPDRIAKKHADIDAVTVAVALYDPSAGADPCGNA